MHIRKQLGRVSFLVNAGVVTSFSTDCGKDGEPKIPAYVGAAKACGGDLAMLGPNKPPEWGMGGGAGEEAIAFSIRSKVELTFYIFFIRFRVNFDKTILHFLFKFFDFS